mmetsp:Transcript_8820/g.20554  ORF Transcript_8820/g.20554 Transcript_8820/m.20554 type:complete len:176 (+) Transcript_8820:236-763(+)
MGGVESVLMQEENLAAELKKAQLEVFVPLMKDYLTARRTAEKGPTPPEATRRAALKTIEKFDSKSEKVRTLMAKKHTDANSLYSHRQKLKQRSAALWCASPPLHKVDFSVDTQTADAMLQRQSVVAEEDRRALLVLTVRLTAQERARLLSEEAAAAAAAAAAGGGALGGEEEGNF